MDMPSPQAKAIENQFRLMREMAETAFDLEQERENTQAAYELTGTPKRVHYEWSTLAGVSVLRAIPEADRDLYNVVFLHGGAFCLMSAWTHHRLAGHIATASQAKVIVPDYALAPEKPFPAALDECLAVVRGAREEHAQSLTALMGDSAGGGLALSVLLQIRDAGVAPPFAAVLMAPWLDLTLASQSITTAATEDVILTEHNLRETACLYLNGARAEDPRASPIFGDFRGLPSLYVQASGRDLLRDDSTRLWEAFIEQGLELQFDLFPDMLHSFQFFAGNIPEADEAVRKAADFLDQVLAADQCEREGAG